MPNYTYDEINRYEAEKNPKLMGSKVKNPTHRAGLNDYCRCRHCGKYYTHLGIARHWPRCKSKPTSEASETD